VTPKQINLATMVTDSGPLPGATAGNYRGTAAYLAMVNAQGGICGRQLVTQEGDDGLDPSKGRADFERLQPNVFAFVGNLAAADSGYIDLIRSTGVPYVSATVDPSGRNIPNAYPKQIPGMVSDAPYVWWRQQHPKSVNAAVLYTAVNGVTTNLPPTVAAIKKAGFNVVYEDGLSPTSPDYTPQVLTMRNKGVDMVYLFAVEVNMHARLIRDMRQQAFQPAIQGVQLSYDTEYQRLLGSEGDGWENPITYAPHLDPTEASSNPGLAAFDTWTNRLFPSAKNDFFAVNGWYNTDYFVKALKSINGPLTRQALVSALGAIHSMDGFGMIPAVDPTDGRPTNCFVMAKSQGGQWKREAPPNGYICNIGEVFQS
jgi:ABC-type branched-subunit amino acid transport system substrate-binding protein